MRKYSIVICVVLVATLLVTYEPYKIEAIGCTYEVDPDTSSGVLEDYGWWDEVEFDMSKDMGSNTALWTYVHVSGELDKDKCGFAGINDGNRISDVISGANPPIGSTMFTGGWMAACGSTVITLIHRLCISPYTT